MKGVYIFLADGFEDVEALAVNDVLRRGGVGVSIVSVGDEPFVSSSHGLLVGTDISLAGLNSRQEGTGSRDIMIFPGGMPGSRNLASSEKLIGLMKDHYAAGGSLAAICAAPGLVLGRLDCLEGVEFTCFDGFQDGPVSKGAVFRPEPAVRSGRIITGRSAGHAVTFGLEILRMLEGDDAADKVRHAMYL